MTYDALVFYGDRLTRWARLKGSEFVAPEAQGEYLRPNYGVGWAGALIFVLVTVGLIVGALFLFA